MTADGSDENQILVPPSFVALYSNPQGRLQCRPDALRARYELCEDLASALVEQAQQLYHGPCPSEPQVLLSLHQALAAPEAGLTPAEARWCIQRLAELLAWPCPLLDA
ncbi:hypothetical protein G7045_10080 [Acidovorax sp. HDW3]|uniref:hypothetical protein n=1 Tax=Acidovorax sp. HDW3 TaxID=2714923 RepID=UPI00140B2A30|nr:hypothetical protein [Acidovorax sp. HDW3]QIL44583.1 hypothetical protein G7045_10080 [Acidovorax sp. HDW3]